MAAPSGQQPERLEDQLRNMILSNVSAGGTPPLHDPRQRQPQQPQQPQPTQRRGGNGSSYGRQNLPTRSPAYGTPVQMSATPPNGQYWQYQNQQALRGPNQPSHPVSTRPFQEDRYSRPNVAPQHSRPFQHRPQNMHGPGSQRPLDPNAFQRRYTPLHQQNQRQAQQSQLWQPSPHQHVASDPDQWYLAQAAFLDTLAAQEVPKVEMDSTERAEKEAFPVLLDSVCQRLTDTDESGRLPKISLQCFGSLKSGFASKNSDMDLVIVADSASENPTQLFSLHELDLPRRLERELLDLGHGARLLTRTRVPIIKVCERPTPELLKALRDERAKWDALSDDEKYPKLDSPSNGAHPDKLVPADVEADAINRGGVIGSAGTQSHSAPAASLTDGVSTENKSQPSTQQYNAGTAETAPSARQNPIETNLPPTGEPSLHHAQPGDRRDPSKSFTREKKRGLLDFPKTGVGIQCDINFSNPLGLHNTQLLRCYCLCDARVRPMVLFIKAWAKQRKINSSYSGTLSSYGYVLMVLHFLMNMTRPAVIPNLQSAWRPAANCTPPMSDPLMVDGFKVAFWREEQEIMNAAKNGWLTRNRDSLGVLLRGFFQYYGTNGGFMYMRDVLCLRVPGGLLTKEYKGWTGAKTTIADNKEVRHRYLFAIEDPF
ncbi:hypothetical protein LTR66_014584, partial [Elasticomyces elasticus]